MNKRPNNGSWMRWSWSGRWRHCPANPKPNLLPLFSRLDDLTRQLPRETDPSLLHYLHKEKLRKARLFLQRTRSGECPREFIMDTNKR